MKSKSKNLKGFSRFSILVRRISQKKKIQQTTTTTIILEQCCWSLIFLMLKIEERDFSCLFCCCRLWGKFKFIEFSFFSAIFFLCSLDYLFIIFIIPFAFSHCDKFNFHSYVAECRWQISFKINNDNRRRLKFH